MVDRFAFHNGRTADGVFLPMVPSKQSAFELKWPVYRIDCECSSSSFLYGTLGTLDRLPLLNTSYTQLTW